MGGSSPFYRDPKDNGGKMPSMSYQEVADALRKQAMKETDEEKRQEIFTLADYMQEKANEEPPPAA